MGPKTRINLACQFGVCFDLWSPSSSKPYGIIGRTTCFTARTRWDSLAVVTTLNDESSRPSFDLSNKPKRCSIEKTKKNRWTENTRFRRNCLGRSLTSVQVATYQRDRNHSNWQENSKELLGPSHSCMKALWNGRWKLVERRLHFLRERRHILRSLRVILELFGDFE